MNIAQEKFSDIARELPALFDAQWDEAVVDKDGQNADCDWATYLRLELAGMLHCMTARDEGKLVGYFFNFVTPHLHTRSVLVSGSDLLYVSPAYRKSTIAHDLIKASEAGLKSIGVKKMYINVKVGRVSKLIKRLGFRHIEEGYSKWIQ